MLIQSWAPGRRPTFSSAAPTAGGGVALSSRLQNMCIKIETVAVELNAALRDAARGVTRRYLQSGLSVSQCGMVGVR